jgi:hypothetical protein
VFEWTSRDGGRAPKGTNDTVFMWIVSALLLPILAQAASVTFPLSRLGYHLMLQLYVGGGNSTAVPNILVDVGFTTAVLLQGAIPDDGIVDNSTTPGIDAIRFVSDNLPYSVVDTFPATLNLSGSSNFGFSNVGVATALRIEPWGLHALNEGIHDANGLLGLRGGAGPVILASALGPPAASTHLVFALKSEPIWSENATATLTVGSSVADVPAADVQWAEQWLPGNLSSSLAFMAYRVAACGVETALNSTANVIVTVNTASSCLTLPGEMFDAAVAWLPIRCSKFSENTVTTTPTCVLTVNSSVAVKDLPEMPLLSFQAGLDGPTVAIDLRSLLLTKNGSVVGNGLPVCLLRGRTLSIARRMMLPSVSSVVLGTLALQGLELFVDLGSRRVGFRSPAVGLGVNTSQCQPRAMCIGQQSYYVPGNTCVPPPCGQYIFKRLDHQLQTCVFVSACRCCDRCCHKQYSMWLVPD